MIVEFYGQLGNQMFQYAFSKAIEEKYSKYQIMSDFYKYGRSVGGGTANSQIENVFGFNLNRCSQEDSERLGYRKKVIPTRVADVLKIPAFKNAKNIVTEKNYHSAQVVKDTYFRGFWQSEDYFAEAKDEVLNSFIFPSLDAKNRKVVEDMQKSNSCSIHVRHGDYLQKNNRNYFVTLSETAYYDNAIKLLQKDGNRIFYIFSDDVPWCREHFKGIDAVFVDWNNTPEDSWKDMCLMSHCKANIVANSSFSWWGAYLSGNTEILAPSTLGKLFEKQHNNYYPTGWIRVAID